MQEDIREKREWARVNAPLILISDTLDLSIEILLRIKRILHTYKGVNLCRRQNNLYENVDSIPELYNI